MAIAAMPGKTMLPDLGERRLHPRAQLLNSWKEIAEFLKCGVRTAQRWERDLFLPVYRPRPGKRGPVCAFPSELQLWMRRNQSKADGQAPGSSHRALIIHVAHQLSHQSAELVRLAAANTRLQKEYAARLLQTIETLKARIERTSRFGRAS